MLENILTGVIFGLVTAGLLELWRRVRAHRAEQVVAAGPDAAPAAPKSPAGGTILRLLLATLIGFVMGGITAGLLEEMGVEDIAFGSLLANTLIAIWTGFVWWLLSGHTSNMDKAA